jgi:hypothetical protein
MLRCKNVASSIHGIVNHFVKHVFFRDSLNVDMKMWNKLGQFIRRSLLEVLTDIRTVVAEVTWSRHAIVFRWFDIGLESWPHCSLLWSCLQFPQCELSEMAMDGSLPGSQGPAAELFPKSAESMPHFKSYFTNINCSNIFPSTSMSSKWTLSFRFWDKYPARPFVSLYVLHIPPSPLNLISLMTFGDK